MAHCIDIDTLEKGARHKRCAGGGYDPDSGREEAICRAYGVDGWSDLVSLAAPFVRDELVAPLLQDAPFMSHQNR